MRVSRRAVTLGVLLAAVASTMAGCVFVPVGPYGARPAIVAPAPVVVAPAPVVVWRRPYPYWW